MKKKEKIIGSAVILCLFLLVLLGIMQSRKPTTLSEDEINNLLQDSTVKSFSNGNVIDISDENENNETNKNIMVEVKGEVLHPNVYELKVGSRINDLISKAGGVTEGADLTNINRATILSDGQCVVVGNKGDINNNEEALNTNNESINNSSEGSSKVNINTASKSELMNLNGVGEVKADNIIKYRDKVGRFRSIEELSEVDGIGIKTVEKLKDGITVK